MLRSLGPLSFKNGRIKLCEFWDAILRVAVLARRHLVVIWWPPITCNAEPPCAASFTLGVMSGVGWRGSPRWHGIRLIVQEGLEDPLILLDEVASTGCFDHHCFICSVRKVFVLQVLILEHRSGDKHTTVVWLLILYGCKARFEILAVMGCDAAKISAYRRFVTICRSHLQEWSSPKKNAGNTWVRSYTENSVGGDWLSEYVKLGLLCERYMKYVFVRRKGTQTSEE